MQAKVLREKDKRVRSLLLLEQILEDKRPQVRPRACTSAPPSLSFPSLTGANPSCLVRSATGAMASSSSLDRKTTRWLPSTTGFGRQDGRNQVIEAFHELAPVNAHFVIDERRRP